MKQNNQVMITSNVTFRLYLLYSSRSILLLSSRSLRPYLSNKLLCLLFPKFSMTLLLSALYLCLEFLEQLLCKKIIAAAIQRTGAQQKTSRATAIPLSLLSGEKERKRSECALLCSSFVFDTVQAICKV